MRYISTSYNQFFVDVIARQALQALLRALIRTEILPPGEN
jgi:hypothetical protein